MLATTVASNTTAADDFDDGKRVCITVRVDTHDVVQLICKHPYLTSSLVVGGHNGVGLGWKPRAAEL